MHYVCKSNGFLNTSLNPLTHAIEGVLIVKCLSVNLKTFLPCETISVIKPLVTLLTQPLIIFDVSLLTKSIEFTEALYS